MTSAWKRTVGLRQVEPGRHLALDPAAGARRGGRRSRRRAAATSGSSGQASSSNHVADPELGRGRWRAAAAARGATPGGSTGRARSSGRGPSSRSATVRAIGPATAMSAWVSVPGGPGIWPWAARCRSSACARTTPDMFAGQPDRAADVGADLERREPRRQRRGRAARRAAGRALDVPRVVGGAEHLVVALHVAGVDRQVRLAPDRRRRRARTRRHRRGVLGRRRGRPARARRTWCASPPSRSCP